MNNNDIFSYNNKMTFNDFIINFDYIGGTSYFRRLSLEDKNLFKNFINGKFNDRKYIYDTNNYKKKLYTYLMSLGKINIEKVLFILAGKYKFKNNSDLNKHVNLYKNNILNEEFHSGVSRKYNRNIFITINNEPLYNKNEINENGTNIKEVEQIIMNKFHLLMNPAVNITKDKYEDNELINMIKFTISKDMNLLVYEILSKKFFRKYPFLNYRNKDRNKLKKGMGYLMDVVITSDIDPFIYIDITINENIIEEKIKLSNNLRLIKYDRQFYIGTTKTNIYINYLLGKEEKQIEIESKIDIHQNFIILFDILNMNIEFPNEIIDFLLDNKDDIQLLTIIKESPIEILYILFDIKLLKIIKELLFNLLDTVFNEKIKKNSKIEDFKRNILNNLIKELIISLKINNKNITLLHFLNEIIIIYKQCNLKIHFFNIVNTNYNDFENIINYKINIYSKIIKIYTIINNYNKNFLSSNEKNILKQPLKKTLYNFSIKPQNPKNYKDINNSDFLIISYNENEKSFNENDCISLLFKLIIEEPFIVILCTQESFSINNFQTIFQNLLLNGSYRNINIFYKNNNVKTSLYIKNDLFWVPKYNKITKDISFTKYFIENKSEKNSFIFKEREVKKTDKKSIFNLILKEKKLKTENFNERLNKNKYEYFIDKKNKILSNEIADKFILKKYSFRSNKNMNSLCLELIIKKKKEYKFIIINSKLYNDNTINSELKKSEEFLNLIDEFKLLEFYKKGYNIFCCGSLNFNLFKMNISEEVINKNIAKIKNNYFEKKRDEFYQQYKNSNELIEILKKGEINELLNNFLESIELIGYDLTCKHKIKDNENENNSFDIISKSNNEFIMPKMCDRIIFSSIKNDLLINSINFNMYLSPKKSNHKMITLSFNLELI